MSETHTVPSFGAMLRRALGDALAKAAGEDFFAMCAKHILFEMPFAPKGAVRVLRGRDALLAYLPKAGELIAFESMSVAKAYKATDSETYTLEFTCKASCAETGARYDQDFISLVRVQNGLIVHYRDYWNPLILLQAVGGAEKLTSHFEGFHNA